MLQRLDRAFPLKPTHIIYLGGTNDAYWGQNLNTVTANAVEINRRCKEQKVKLIIGLPTPVDEPQVEALLAEYRAFYIDLAMREGLYVIPFQKAFLDDTGRFKSELTTDGCHPNIDGYEAMAEVVENVLAKFVL
jgi:lysophospholipase L1-like esterase